MAAAAATFGTTTFLRNASKQLVVSTRGLSAQAAPRVHHHDSEDTTAAISIPAAAYAIDDAKQKQKLTPPRRRVTFHCGTDLHFYVPHDEPAAARGRRTAPQQPSTNNTALPDGKAAAAVDHFEGVPFRALAEFLGGAYMDATEEARANAKEADGMARAPVSTPVSREGPRGRSVPFFLPCTAAFASTQAFESTFVVDEDVNKRRTRLSWYHPEDTMVPRGWFRDGLLADMAWYRPFRDGNGW